MSVNYNRISQTNYLRKVDEIVLDYNSDNLDGLVENINQAFFEGGVFAPKSFSALATLHIPQPPDVWEVENALTVSHLKACEQSTFATFRPKKSISACLGYIEAIPVIGSAIAILNVIGHLFCLMRSYQNLQDSIMAYEVQEVKDSRVISLATDVFEAAISYTVHRNHLIGSALSIIPLVKPAARLLQGLSYSPVEDHAHS